MERSVARYDVETMKCSEMFSITIFLKSKRHPAVPASSLWAGGYSVHCLETAALCPFPSGSVDILCPGPHVGVQVPPPPPAILWDGSLGLVALTVALTAQQPAHGKCPFEAIVFPASVLRGFSLYPLILFIFYKFIYG